MRLARWTGWRCLVAQRGARPGSVSFDYLTTTLPFIIEMWPGKVQKKL
jgi:hypothetical protein